MIDVKVEDGRAIIDVRELINNGVHPRGEIIKYAREASPGTVIEIHLPFRAEPLIGGLETLGLNVVGNEIEPGHYRLMTVKL
jgi:hypothetical protein